MSIADNYVRHPKWKRLTPELRQRWDAATARGAFALGPEERPWRARVPFLLSKGYRLRARFQPDWVPSWKGTDIHPKDCEDSIRFTGKNTIDGKRIEDNKIVSIKHISLSHPGAKHEVEMHRLAASLPGNENRTLPFVDALEDADTDSLYLITEWASPFNQPEFFNGLEIVDFVHQTLSCLAFLHSRGIVHNDIRAENVRMDARPLTPGVTPHPQLPLHALDGAPVSEPLRRSEAPRIRYFVSGFARANTVGWETSSAAGERAMPRPDGFLEVNVETGMSDDPEDRTPIARKPQSQEPEEVMLLAGDDDSSTPRTTPGTPETTTISIEAAKDDVDDDDDDTATIMEKLADLDVEHTRVPDATDDVPPPPPPASEKRKSTLQPAEDLPPPPPPAKDPFKKDIFDLGQLYSREFTEKYSNCEFIQPLIDCMTTVSPEQRYTAEECLYFLRQIRYYMTWFEQNWALKRRDSSVGDSVVNGLYTGLNLMGIKKFRWQARIQDPMLPDPGS